MIEGQSKEIRTPADVREVASLLDSVEGLRRLIPRFQSGNLQLALVEAGTEVVHRFGPDGVAGKGVEPSIRTVIEGYVEWLRQYGVDASEGS